MDVPQFLVDRAGAHGTVSWLIGPDWPVYQRFLHPSRRASDPDVPVSWQQVATEREVGADLARADWYAVSGQRPNHPDSEYGYPQEGPNVRVLPAVVASLLDAFPAAELAVAEWTGYGDVSPGRAVSGAALVGERALGRERFTVWRTGRRLPADGFDPTTGVRANYVWSLGGEFVVAADDDVLSTYVGCVDAPVAWNLALERTQVGPDSPLG